MLYKTINCIFSIFYNNCLRIENKNKLINICVFYCVLNDAIENNGKAKLLFKDLTRFNSELF